jgi:hypothetical protein
MKTKYKSFIFPKRHAFSAVWSVAILLLLGVLTSFAQSGIYLYTGSMTTITMNPGIYDITAYGAQGGGSGYYSLGSLGAEMEGEFNFTTATKLTLLVGGAGVSGGLGAGGGGGFGGGGGGSLGGGGGGSVIDSSAIADLVEVSGVASPDNSPNGEIIITAVPEPSALALLVVGTAAFVMYGHSRSTRKASPNSSPSER